MSKSAAPRKDPATGGWWFIVDIAPHPDGRRRQAKRRGFTTKTAAQEALDELRVTARQGTYVAPARQTVGELLEEWLVSVKPALKPATWSSYRRNMRLHVRPRIGGTQLQALDASALNRMYGELLDNGSKRAKDTGLSPRSVRYIHTILHRAFSDAERWGRIARNPAAAATPPRAVDAKAPELHTWTAADLTRFLNATRDERHWAAWQFIATTGCRRGEAIGLRWSDVDLERGTAVVRQTVGIIDGQIVVGDLPKSNKPRTIHLAGATVDALKTWRKRRLQEQLALGLRDADGLVFPTELGEVQDPDSFAKVFERRRARHGLPKLSIHGLRHTWATLALEAGVHPKVVQEQLGHHSVSFTLDRYSHVTPVMANDGVEKVAALLSS
jgi:integrase